MTVTEDSTARVESGDPCPKCGRSIVVVNTKPADANGIRKRYIGCKSPPRGCGYRPPDNVRTEDTRAGVACDVSTNPSSGGKVDPDAVADWLASKMGYSVTKYKGTEFVRYGVKRHGSGG